MDFFAQLDEAEDKGGENLDKAVTTLSKMVMLKQYSRDKWEEYWKQKPGIEGYFSIQIQSVRLSPCKHF